MIYSPDTNIISFLLQERSLVIQKFNQAAANNDIVISPIVYYEVHRGLLAVNAPKKLASFEIIKKTFPIKNMTFRMWKLAAEIHNTLRKSGLIIEDTDILIAAFCLSSGYTLVTNNVKHFARIDGLSIADWSVQEPYLTGRELL
jgi:predicted nucleic acid-binding protein